MLPVPVGVPNRLHCAAATAAPLVLKVRWLAGLAAAHMAASSPAPCSPRSLTARKAAARASASGCTAALGSTVGQLADPGWVPAGGPGGGTPVAASHAPRQRTKWHERLPGRGPGLPCAQGAERRMQHGGWGAARHLPGSMKAVCPAWPKRASQEPFAANSMKPEGPSVGDVRPPGVLFSRPGLRSFQSQHHLGGHGREHAGGLKHAAAAQAVATAQAGGTGTGGAGAGDKWAPKAETGGMWGANRTEA